MNEKSSKSFKSKAPSNKKLVCVASGMLANPKTDQIANKAIFGVYGDQTAGIWYAIPAALRNGLIQAIYPALDEQVTIGTVQHVEAEEDTSRFL